MKRIILSTKILFMAILTAGVSSCESLDEGSEGLVATGTFYSDANTLDAGIVGIYGTLRRNTWGLDNYSHYAGADDLTSRLGSNKWVVLEADQFARTAGNSWSTNDYNGNYSAIYAANSFIENANPPGVDEAVIKAAKANAYFVRGLCYFRLATTFGDVPMPLTDIPNYEITLTPKRDVLAQVISDLEFAAQWADNPRDLDPSVNNGRVTKTAAKAFLAKTYLQLTGYPYNEDKWQEVKDLTSDIIGEGVYSLMDDYAHSFQDPHQVNKEVIHAHVMSRESWPIITQNRVYGFRFANWMDMYMEWNYYNNFPAGYRKEFSTTADASNQFFVEFGNPIVTKFTWGTKAPNTTDPVDHVFEHTWQTSNDRIAMRYSEVLLMYAEACAQKDELTEAVEKLNWVRRRAYADGSTKQAEVALLPAEFWKTANATVDLVSTDKAVILDEIITERAYEFLGEIGGNRWLDLVRLDKVAEVNAARDPSDVPLIGDPSDKSLWWTPIPATETVLNPNL